MDHLLENILNGDQNAFSGIIQKFGDRLTRLAYQYFHDWDLAKEVSHHTFIKVFKNLEKYDRNKPLEPWITKIHINNCRSWYRKQKLLSGMFIKLSASDTIYRENPERNHDMQVIMNCVDSLSWKQKTAFILMEIEEKTSKDAGILMDCSDATARVHLNRAKQRLRTKLKKLGYDNE